ncbi:glycoside hydrolase family 57 protein [Candidatus Bathyarchaeota archaeon]|nr:glycoside hydrolase family 57 protein [Candidatus Bathyarchaeota archaeon]
MADICLIFEVHQPFRLNRNFNLNLITREKAGHKDLFNIYFDHKLNKEIFERVSEKCYFPASEIILEQINRFKKEKKRFKVSFSFSGVFLEQCEMWSPDLLELFKQIVKTRCVELLSQTYYHSLSSLNPLDKSEFFEQVKMHHQTIKEKFRYEPKVFENTECLYNDEIAKAAEKMGFEAIVTEGTEKILGWRSPNFVYKASGSKIKVLLRNYRLSDDIGFRFASTEWDQWPLTADKYAAWLAHTPGQVIILFMDYETFGEHYWAESGILEFLKWLPIEVSRWNNLSWSTPSEVIRKYASCDEIRVPADKTISWADAERNTGAWLGSLQQKVAFNFLNEVGLLVKELNDGELLRIWRYLQTSDHFYYMYARGGESGMVHDSFNPYGSSMEAFITYIGILLNFEAVCKSETYKPSFKYRRLLRRVPADKAFKFYYRFAKPTDVSASSLQEFYEALKRVSLESIAFHTDRGDFERWISNVIGDDELADRIANLPKKWRGKRKLRHILLTLVGGRIKELKNLMENEK